MLITSLFGGLASVGVGFLWKRSTDGRQAKRITDREFAITAALVFFVASPLTAFVGYQLAIRSNVTYFETRSGWEQRVIREVTTCTRDGSCRWEYQCDPYTVTYTDRDGKTRKETRYHDCPYLSKELTYKLDTTAGTITIADQIAPPDPQNYRWRAWVPVPDRIPSGVPETWAASRDRLNAGKPGPAAIRYPYENYILASQNTLLRRYSDQVAEFTKQGLLPSFKFQVVQDYLLNRTSVVGVSSSEGQWFDSINRFNAAFGSDLQGDLHLVLVDSGRVNNKDEYLNALVTYWQSAQFGKNALAKNTVVVVLGCKDGKVEWARAATGMPSGNEAMLLDIQNKLPGTPVSPEAILGSSDATISGGTVSYSRPQGALAKVVWGQHQFKRICMKCDGEADRDQQAGFAYLLNEVQPNGGQIVLIFVGILLVSGAFWWYVYEN